MGLSPTYTETQPDSTSRSVPSRRKKSAPPKILVPKNQWVEDAPSYLDGIQATLATLTDEEKEALHLSLQG